jgi:IS605 OrfB family transposase
MPGNAAFHPKIETVGFQTAFSVKMNGSSNGSTRKWVEVPHKAEKQRQENPQMPVVTVDLGVNRLAVMGAFGNGRFRATRFVDGRALNHRWHRLLAAIHRKRQQSGSQQTGTQDNAALWNKIRNLDKNSARQTAVAIVQFAKEHGAKVIVFEHLRSYRPPKKKRSQSGQKNHKLGYWLRGQIMKWVRDLAFREGILTVERNPAYTS